MDPVTTTLPLEERPRAGLDVVHELIRAFKVRRLYDPGHPQRRDGTS